MENIFGLDILNINITKLLYSIYQLNHLSIKILSIENILSSQIIVKPNQRELKTNHRELKTL